jgi:hypothetical protein
VLRSQIGLQGLEYLDAEVEINNVWKIIRGNIKMSAKESLGYYELKQHQLWFDKDDQCC